MTGQKKEEKEKINKKDQKICFSWIFLSLLRKEAFYPNPSTVSMRPGDIRGRESVLRFWQWEKLIIFGKS